MQRKYFTTKKFGSYPLNSLSPSEIKDSYSKELNKSIVSRTQYYNSVANTLGFDNWHEYQNEYNNKIIPFMQNNGLKEYAPSVNRNILKAEHDISFSYRQISDRLFFSNKALPKSIFTGYLCKTDNFGYFANSYLSELNELASFNGGMYPVVADTHFSTEFFIELLESDIYHRILEEQELDLLIPMDISSFSVFKNLIGDTFLITENSNENYLCQLYNDNEGLVEEQKLGEIARIFKKELLKIEKGWIDIIPFNDNLIFLKAEDGTYDFIFKNLREDRFHSPYGKYIKHENIPSLLNEDYDFERWLYFGFKDTNKYSKDDQKKLKNIKPLELWKDRDEHLSEINFYENNEIKNYPGSSQILKDFYIKEGLYSYSPKSSKKILDNFESIELDDKILNVSQLVSIKDFFEFYKNSYNKTRSSELDEIQTVNYEDENLPVSVTWYDAIAYCRYLENKHNVHCRLLTRSEFENICPKYYNNKGDNPLFIDPKAELDFFYENQKIQSPPPYMGNFNDVIMKYRTPLEYVEKNNLKFCTNTTFKEWSNHFREGYGTVLSARYPDLNINHANIPKNNYQANFNNKYKYIKIGFRVCYESSKDLK